MYYNTKASKKFILNLGSKSWNQNFKGIIDTTVILFQDSKFVPICFYLKTAVWSFANFSIVHSI